MSTDPTSARSQFLFGQAVPQIPDPHIDRDNILVTIEQLFSGSADVVMLEAPEGCGKTVTATLFANRHSDRVFTMFIGAGSRWAYDPAAQRNDLCYQFAAATGKPLAADVGTTDAAYRTLLLSLRRWLRNSGTAYFVVDGLTEIPTADSGTARQIWDLLPFDFQGLKFLITRDSKSGVELPVPKSTKTMILPVLGMGETVKLFEVLGVGSADAEQLHKTCMGQPGRVETVRRLIKSGLVKTADLVGDFALQFPNLLDIEWRLTESLDQPSRLALAVIANGGRPHTLEELARLSGSLGEHLGEQLRRLTFLDCGGDGESFSFVSEPFRRYALDKLRSLRKDVEDSLISDLFSRKEDGDSAAALASMLHSAGRYEQLLGLLTPEHFESTLKHNQSMTPVKQQVDLGVQASKALKRDSELVRFTIHKTALMQLESTEVWKSEVEARIALDDFATAQAMANAAGLREDRIHLLAVVAKGKVRRGLLPPPELLETIESLYRQVDHRHLGDRALEIASDLVYSLPALAMDMVEQSARAEPERADVAMATLAINTPQSVLSKAKEDVGSEMRERIRSPQLRKFIEEVKVPIRDTSAQEILAQVQKLSTAQKQLFFLRQWTTQNRRREDAWQVVEAAISLAIRSAEYTPNARDLRELASPLPFVGNPERLRRLVELFAAHKGNIERYGPTVDYVRLLLLAAQGEYRHDKPAGRGWFEDAYLYTSLLTDRAVQAECYARLLAALTLADPGKDLELSDKMHSLSESGLRKSVSDLQEATAFHDTVFAGVIQALAPTRIDIAVEVATSLNTEPRRDTAMVDLVDAAFASENPPGGFAKACETIRKISNPEDRDDAVFKVLDRASARRVVHSSWARDVLQILDLAEVVSDPEVRSGCLSRIYVVLAKADPPADANQILAVYKKLTQSVSTIDIGWEKVRAGFEAAALLAPHSAVHARALLDLAEDSKSSAILQTENAARAYIGTLLLAFSAYTGLLQRRLTEENDFSRLADLVEQIPSDGERARIWAEFAVRVHAAKDTQLCQRIVTDRVRPLLQKVKSTSSGYAARVLADVAPALYCAYPVSAADDFAALPVHLKDRAYSLGRVDVFSR